MSIIEIFNSFSKIYKIKIILSIISSIIFLVGLYIEGSREIFSYIVGSGMTLGSGIVWNKYLYDKMQEERPFKMSFYIFDRVTLIFPIVMLFVWVGLLLR